MPAGGPHGQCFEMLASDWPPTQSTPEVIVPLVSMPKTPTDFPGMLPNDLNFSLISFAQGFSSALAFRRTVGQLIANP